MALLTNSAEGGTNGVTVTTGNSGGDSGDAWDGVTLGAGSLEFASAQAQKGSLSYAVSGVSASTTFVHWLPVNSTQCVFRAYVRFSGLPSAGQHFLRLLNAAGSVTRVDVGMGSNGSIFIQDIAGSTIHNTSGSASLAVDTWYRIEGSVDTPSSTTGALILKIFEGDSATPLSGFDISLTGQDFGTAGVARFQFGKATSSGTWPTQFWDDVAFEDNTLTLLGPSTSFDPANLINTGQLGPDVTLEWDASPTGGVTEYVICRVPGEAVANLDPVADEINRVSSAVLTYTDEAVAAGEYTWQVFGRIP